MVDAPPVVAVIGTRGYPSYYGGFETAVRRLVPHLADTGWNVRVYGRPGEVSETDPSRDPRITSVTTRGLNSNALSTLTFGLTSVLHACWAKPDVALVMNVANGFWIPLLRARRIPVVVNVDGIEWERAKWNRFAKWIFKLGARFTAKFANELIFDAQAIGRYWYEHFGRTGTFIPYGGESLQVAPLLEDVPPAPFVLVVARFVPENTVGEFLEAVDAITSELEVVIVGAGAADNPLQLRAQKLAAENSRVHHQGHVSDDVLLHSLWDQAAVYFHGHSVGGTNPALVQAMALGSHVVARDTVYNREVLGELARFVGPDPAEIARAVIEEFRAPTAPKRDIEDRAAENYSWASVCTAYEETIRRMVTLKHPAA